MSSVITLTIRFYSDQIGIDLVNMDRVQVHPTGFIDPQAPSAPSKILAPEALRGSGGVLLNGNGQRFANELGSRGYLTSQIQAQCRAHEDRLESGRDQPVTYMVIDQKVRCAAWRLLYCFGFGFV